MVFEKENKSAPIGASENHPSAYTIFLICSGHNFSSNWI